MTVNNKASQVGIAIRWLLLAVLPGIAFPALLSLPSPLGFDQLGNGTLEEVLLTAGRWLGMAITGWLIVSQVLYTVAVLTRTNWMIDVLRPITLPVVRRIVVGAAAITISMSTVAAGAQTPLNPAILVVEEGAESGLRQEAMPSPVLQPLKPAADDGCVPPVGSYSAPLTWQVRPGDHLWSIAGEHLSIVLDRRPTDAEHSRYWVQVVEAARPIIRSGDPDLIYPGEEIPLPAMLDARITP